MIELQDYVKAKSSWSLQISVHETHSRARDNDDATVDGYLLKLKISNGETD